jgi:hypothetical protein
MSDTQSAHTWKRKGHPHLVLAGPFPFRRRSYNHPQPAATTPPTPIPISGSAIRLRPSPRRRVCITSHHPGLGLGLGWCIIRTPRSAEAEAEAGSTHARRARILRMGHRVRACMHPCMATHQYPVSARTSPAPPPSGAIAGPVVRATLCARDGV